MLVQAMKTGVDNRTIEVRLVVGNTQGVSFLPKLVEYTLHNVLSSLIVFNDMKGPLLQNGEIFQKKCFEQISIQYAVEFKNL